MINRIKENPNHLLLSIDNIIDPKSDKQSERQPYFKEEKENFNEKVQLDHFFTDKENSFSKSKSSVDSTNSKTFEDLKNIKYLIISLLNEKKINHSPIIWSEKTFMQLGEIINELSSKYDINSDKFEELLSEQMELQSHGLFKVTTLNWIGTTDMNVSLFALLITHKLTLENILCSNCSSGCIYANVYNSQIQSKPTTNDFVNSDNTTKVNYSMTLICKNKRVTPSNMEFSSESSNYFQKFKGNTNATTDSEITRLTNFSNFKDKAYLQKMAKLSF